MDFAHKDPSPRWIPLILVHFTCLVALAWGCAAGSTEKAIEPDSGIQEGTTAAPPSAVVPFEATYIVDGRQRLTDPTIQTREQDDFGGYNSILYVDGSA